MNELANLLPTRRTRSSAISQTLERIGRELPGHSAGIEFNSGRTEHQSVWIKVATDTKTRERAYRLAYDIYAQRGYAIPDPRELAVGPFDAEPGTLTLLAVDRDGQDIGTISLNLDVRHHLPCDEIFSAEVDALRDQGSRLAEVTRLAVKSADARSKQLIIRLFYSVYLYAFRLKNVTDLVIEVNPRHVGFYQRLMKFSVLGPERACSRVQYAPAVLLSLDLAEITQRYERMAVSDMSASSDLSNTLYGSFPLPKEADAMEQYLAQRHQPMTAFQMRYFGLNKDSHKPGICLEIATA